jgi:hypothetical protein|tara:strand:+ start:62 stop:244 length:183 start_codon:yes stop_codon:yes gene_type:complete
MDKNYLIIGILMILAGGLYLFYRINTYKPNKDDNMATDLRLDLTAIMLIVVGGLMVYEHF